jgi:membrane-associated protease RseP (regulator of RpoE activity)
MRVAFLIGVVLFAVFIGFSVGLHEAGHMWAAKLFGMKVRRYFIGFGPKIFSFRRGETEYGLKAIPAGGFCDIAGMTPLEELTDEDERDRAMYKRPTWQRVVVLSAGSAMHFILGVIVLFVMALSYGLPNLDKQPVVGEISNCVAPGQDKVTGALTACAPGAPGPARQAGLQTNDRIVAVGGVPTATYDDVVARTRDSRGPTAFVVERGGQRLTLTVDVATVQRLPDTTQYDPTTGKPINGGDLVPVGAVGLGVAPSVHYSSVLAAVPATGAFTASQFQAAFTGLKQLPNKVPAVIRAIGGEQDPGRPISVVGASRLGGEAAERGLWEVFFLLLAGFNFFIGVLNLLPLLPMDGGHIAVALYQRVRDWVRGLRGLPVAAPVDYTRLLPLTYAVVLVGGALMVLTVTADIVNPISINP